MSESQKGVATEYARVQANAALEAAAKQAGQLVEETGAFARRLQEELQQTVYTLTQQLGEQSLGRLGEILDEYSRELRTALEVARNKTLEQADSFCQDAAVRVSAMERALTDKMATTYQQFQQALQQELEAHSRVAHQMGEQAKAGFDEVLGQYKEELRTILDDVRMETVKEAKAHLASAYQQYEESLAAAKEQKMAEVGQRLQKEIPIAVKEALGQALTAEQHERIVKEALETIKRSSIWR